MPEADDAGYSSDLDDGADAGSCAICYSLHLADPSRPDELGEWLIGLASAAVQQ